MSAIQGERIILEQEKGDPVNLIVTGDEFYARIETRDGYTVVYDNEHGLYCYATLVDGRFRSSEIPLNKRPAPGTRKHLQESPAVRAEKFETRYRTLYQEERVVPGASGIAYTYGENNGLLTGRRVSSGEVLGLTILVEFQDIRASIRSEDVDSLLNDDNYRTNGNYSSVKEYFRKISNGKLTYRNRVIGPVRLSHSRRYYETTPLMREALALAIAQENLDLSDFDSRGDRIVDALSFMYAGRTVYGINGNNNNPSLLWPHNSVLDFQHNNVSTHFYQITSMGRSPFELSIGTFCHESGHMLCRFPDLYDYGRRDSDYIDSAGLGQYCLMSSGNHLNSGRTPAPICGYLRDLVGWPDNLVYLTEPRNYEITHGDYGTIYKYPTDKSNEYFIVENRTRLELDQFIADGGLAVFHCDTEGSNEWQQGTAEWHYQCALLQADGRRDLENGRRGDSDDLYDDVSGVALSNQTLPSSRSWDGADTGLILRNISAVGAVMQFSTGVVPADPAVGSITGQSFPDLLIPDNNPEGVRDSITLAGEGIVTAIKVGVEILHTWEGDIQLNLISPNGTNVLLAENTRQPGSDLIESYDSADHTVLVNLVGEGLTGEWTLHIQDLLAEDTGRLNHWQLTVEYEGTDRSVAKEDNPELDIPDDDPHGITRRIQVDEAGSLKDIEVSLDITHTFIRDLRVELIAPTGHSVFVHNRTGGGSDDIKRTYNRSNLPTLDSLLHLEIQGEWKLQVKDLEGLDVGKLNAWSLNLTYSD